MVYIAISQLHEKDKFSITLLCEIAMIPRSSYYKWVKHEESVLETENKMLMTEIIKIYEEVDGVYGYRRLGRIYSHKCIYRFMRLSELKSVIRRKRERLLSTW